VNQVPVANAGANKTATAGSAVSFSGSASQDPDGTIISYAWAFGDGTTGSGVTVSHPYANAGTYTATLTVTDNSGATGTDTAVVTVNPVAVNQPPIADAGPNKTATVGTPVSLSGSGSQDADGTITSYAWIFGDGASGSGVTVSHTYAAVGTYTARLTVTDNSGATAVDTAIVTITTAVTNQFPIANAGPDKTVTAGVSVSLSASGSMDPDGTLNSYAWTFGDGATGAGVTVAHVYSTAGTYIARLTVTDNAGATASDTAAVSVIPVATNRFPIANAGPDKNVIAGTPVSLSGAGSEDPDGTIAAYAWTFGDGASAGGATVSHTYSLAGVYTARLTVTDNGGATAIDTAVVTVTAPLTNQFPLANAGPDRTATVGTSVTLSGSGSQDPDGTISSYSWSFGDGVSASGMTAVHAYTTVGTFAARLTVTDNTGATASDTATISVTPVATNRFPVASAGGNVAGTAGSPISFSGAASQDPDGTINSYSWNFGDGATATGVSVSHAYPNAGTYTVRLTVTDNSGATASDATVAVVTTPSSTGNGAFMSVTNLGGPAGDAGNTVAVDRFGNAFVGGGTTERPFLAKVSPANVLLWSLTIGGNGSGVIQAVATASDGSVFISGNLYATLDFGGGPLTSAGGHDIFVAKFSANGTHLWSKCFGSPRLSTFLTESAFAIAVGSDDSVVIGGVYDGPIDFGGAVLPTLTSQDVFVAKFSTSGSHLWSRRIGGTTGLPSCRSVAIDGNGGVFVAGSFNFTVDFGGGPVTAVGSPDMYIAKYTSQGAYVWSKQFGIPGTSSRSSISAASVAVDRNGDAVVVGEFRAPVSVGGVLLTNATPGYEDLFVAKYSGSDGSTRWSKRFGAAYPEHVSAVALDSNDNITITGRTSSPVDFGGGPLPLVSGMNGYVASLTADGSHRWSRSFGIYIGDVKSLAVTTTGNLFVVGSFMTLSGYGSAPFSGSPAGIFVLQFAQ
jgi:PKD repeat protein